VLRAIVLSNSENEPEPDGDDDDAPYNVPSHPTLVPTTVNNVPIIIADRVNAANFGPYAQAIADNLAGTLGGSDQFTWNTQSDNTIIMTVKQPDAALNSNVITIDSDDNTDTVTKLGDGTLSSTFVASIGNVSAPWNTMNTDPSGRPTGDLIGITDGSASEIAVTYAPNSNDPQVTAAAFYNTAGQNELARDGASQLYSDSR